MFTMSSSNSGQVQPTDGTVGEETSKYGLLRTINVRLQLPKALLALLSLLLVSVASYVLFVIITDKPSHPTVHVSDSVEDILSRYGNVPCTPEGCYENSYKAECWCDGHVYVYYPGRTDTWEEMGEVRRRLANLDRTCSHNRDCVYPEETVVMALVGSPENSDDEGEMRVRIDDTYFRSTTRECIDVTGLFNGDKQDTEPSFVYNSDGDGYTSFKFTAKDFRYAVAFQARADKSAYADEDETFKIQAQIKTRMDDFWMLQWYDPNRIVEFSIKPTKWANLTTPSKTCSHDEIKAVSTYLGLGFQCSDPDSCDYTDPYSISCTQDMHYKNTWAKIRIFLGATVGSGCDDS